MVGTFLTALEMPGVSISLLRVDDATLALLDAPTQAAAWPGLTRPAASLTRQPTVSVPAEKLPAGAAWRKGDLLRKVLLNICKTLKAQESPLTQLDSLVGDGDLGISLSRGATAIEAAIDSFDLERPALALQQVSAVLRRSLGGTSGPLYAMFVLSAGTHLAGAQVTQLAAWSRAFQAGCDGVMRLGGAQAGERTMLDALLPAATALRNRGQATDAAQCAVLAANAAAQGAEATRQMLPRKGRSSYLGERALGHVDPGAFAVGLWLAAVAEALA